jgi:hypothetical protein
MTTKITRNESTIISTQIDGRSWKRYGLDKSSHIFNGYKVTNLTRNINKVTSFHQNPGEVTHMVEILDLYTNQVEYRALSSCQTLEISQDMEDLTSDLNLALSTHKWSIGIDRTKAAYDLMIDEEWYYLSSI